LASSAGLEIGPRGGIAVDEYQRTSDHWIYAVGDAAEKQDAITGEARVATLAGLANRHGHAVANHIASVRSVPATPALGTSIVTFDGLASASVGLSEKTLRARAIQPRIIHIHPANHAAYYPGAQTMRLKLLVDPQTDLILGAQGVGGEGVDKRIDVIATAMFAKISASELAQLELAYDPQHGSAKDPINMLGYVNRNIAEKVTSVIEWHELDDAIDGGAILIDVRTPGEHRQGAIPGSINIPLDTLRENLPESTTRKVIVHCQVGQRGHTAARILSQEGFDVANLNGGYLTWKSGISSKGTS
jgi:rhodanese-related sulfurtransferase